MKEEVYIEDLKHLRLGHIDQERPVDKFVDYISRALPGKELPQRWAYKSKEHFQAKYGTDAVLWAKTSSYHMLMMHGKHVFRIWTDSPNSALCDIDDSLAPLLSDFFEILEIPESTSRKCKPFTKRVRLVTMENVQQLLTDVLLTQLKY